MASKVLDIREGQDVYVEEDEKLPYRLVRNLGHGHSANVEMVEDIYTGRVFARKLFRIHRTRDQRKAIFDNEIKIIRRLKNHRHIIRVFATYVAKKEVGLILSPVADGGDLESFLNDFAVGQIARKGTTERRLLRKSFGCLAAGLAFMHQQKIRHKDIKPRNILIHRGTMIYTDFGYSFDYSLPDGRSTTTGRPDTFTRKYCAPEVVDWEPRNSKSDVFSLGCVFLEMLAVLDARATLPHCDQPYSAVGEAIKCLFETLEERHSRKNVRSRTTVTLLWSVIYTMLSFDPTQRPTASFITTHIRKQSPTHFFCKDCSDESGKLDPKPSNGDRRNLKIVKSNRTTSARPQNLRQASTDSTQSKEYTCCDSTMVPKARRRSRRCSHCKLWQHVNCIVLASILSDDEEYLCDRCISQLLIQRPLPPISTPYGVMAAAPPYFGVQSPNSVHPGMADRRLESFNKQAVPTPPLPLRRRGSIGQSPPLVYTKPATGTDSPRDNARKSRPLLLEAPSPRLKSGITRPSLPRGQSFGSDSAPMPPSPGTTTLDIRPERRLAQRSAVNRSLPEDSEPSRFSITIRPGDLQAESSWDEESEDEELESDEPEDECESDTPFGEPYTPYEEPPTSSTRARTFGDDNIKRSNHAEVASSNRNRTPTTYHHLTGNGTLSLRNSGLGGGRIVIDEGTNGTSIRVFGMEQDDEKLLRQRKP